MCLSKQFKKFIAIFLLAVISTPITSCVALAQEEAGLTKRAFIFKPTSDVDSGINSNAGVIEKLEVTFEDKYRADGTKYKEFLLESIVSGVAAFSGLPYNGDGAVLPDGFSYVGNLGGGKTPQAQQHQLPQFLCKYTGTANSMDCNVVLYSGGKPTDDFGLSQFVASSITGDKKAAFLETFYSIAYEPTRRSAHFRLRIDLDKLFENQNIVSPSMFVPTSEIGVWFHPRTAFYNFSIDQATGRFTHFAAAKVGWYDSGSEIITDYPGGSKCKDSAPLVLDFDELKHGEIVSNQYADYFTVTGQSATGTQYKVVAFDSSNVHPGLVGLATPGVSLGQGKGPDDFPGHGNTTSKKMILVMSDGQDSNGDGILDGAWNPVFTGGTLSFNFKQPTPVRSIVGINAGLDGNDTYKIGNTVIKIADIHYNSVQTLNMDFPDNATEEEKKVSTLVIQYDNPSGFDDLAICLDCLQQDRDACGVCNGPGKDQCNRCPGDTGFGT
ncbi:MAG: hypothetical protein KDD56_10675, partial [Bdellovibrionales bacterium]|nr:hypothetical protein [Bdellovibrionales bacterium]